jgi:hypothetical protein
MRALAVSSGGVGTDAPPTPTWRCGHERTEANTANRTPSQPGGRCRTCYRAAQKRYGRSEKGRARGARYIHSDRGRAVVKRYSHSEKGRATVKRYRHSEKGRARAKRYNQTPERLKANRDRKKVRGENARRNEILTLAGIISRGGTT